MKKNILKYIAAVMLMMTAVAAKAGNGDWHLGLQSGVMYPRIFSTTLIVDKETKYHNAIEYYMDYFTQWNDCPDCKRVCTDSFWHSKYGLSVGATYKPCVSRSRNSFGRFRIGADMGTNTRNFVLGVELGYEYVWSLRNGVQIALIQKNEINFWAKPTFKNGAQIGVRIPL